MRIDTLLTDYDILLVKCTTLSAELIKVKAERDELSSDLQNYGAHHIDCTIWTATYDERCSCGLNAALARIAAKE